MLTETTLHISCHFDSCSGSEYYMTPKDLKEINWHHKHLSMWLYSKYSILVHNFLCALLFRLCASPFLFLIWKAVPTATLTFFRSMMGTVPLLTWLENTVAKITHKNFPAHTILCIFGFALTVLSMLVASQLLGSLRTQVGGVYLLWFCSERNFRASSKAVKQIWLKNVNGDHFEFLLGIYKNGDKSRSSYTYTIFPEVFANRPLHTYELKWHPILNP